MADQVTTTTTTGYGSRLMSSISGIGIGILLFIGSFGVLYWNEGRVNLADVAKNATPISAEQKNTDATLTGTLVSVMGTLKTAETISEGVYLKPENVISISRTVEMYAWTEKSESKSKTNLGGSETTETTYTYTKEWTSSPAKSSSFKESAGHENPTMPLEGATVTAKNGTIGVYKVAFDQMQLTGSTGVTLTENMLMNKPANATLVNGGTYMYIPAVPAATQPTTTNPTTPGTTPTPAPTTTSENPFAQPAATTTPGTTTTTTPTAPVKTSFDNPAVGDLRVSYSVIPSTIDVTILGKLSGDSIEPFYGPKNTKLFRAFSGTAETAVATLNSEYTMWLWIWRVVGFFMMFIGLSSILNPISTLLDVIPFLGKVSGGIISLASFLAALVLSFVTIIIAMILHSLIAVIIVVALIVGGGYFWYQKKKGAKNAPAAPAAPSAPAPQI